MDGKENTNCPNCGAPITASKCEYCGTVFSNHISEIESLRDKNKLLQSQIRIQQLHEAALRAMLDSAKILKKY